MADIRILATSDEKVGTKSLSSRQTGAVLTILSNDEIKKQFSATIAAVTSAFGSLENQNESLRVKEVVLKFEITVSGEVRLIASAGVDVMGAIEVTLAYN